MRLLEWNGNKILENEDWNWETGKTGTWHFENITLNHIITSKTERKDTENWNCAKRSALDDNLMNNHWHEMNLENGRNKLCWNRNEWTSPTPPSFCRKYLIWDCLWDWVKSGINNPENPRKQTKLTLQKTGQKVRKFGHKNKKTTIRRTNIWKFWQHRAQQ